MKLNALALCGALALVGCSDGQHREEVAAELRARMEKALQSCFRLWKRITATRLSSSILPEHCCDCAIQKMPVFGALLNR
jgi:hypothetical protein